MIAINRLANKWSENINIVRNTHNTPDGRAINPRPRDFSHFGNPADFSAARSERRDAEEVKNEIHNPVRRLRPIVFRVALKLSSLHYVTSLTITLPSPHPPTHPLIVDSLNFT